MPRIRMKENCSTLDGPYCKGKEYDVTQERRDDFTRAGFADDVKTEEKAETPPGDKPPQEQQPPAPKAKKK